MGYGRVKRRLGGNFGRIFRFLSAKVKNNNNTSGYKRGRKRKIAQTSAKVLNDVLGGQSYSKALKVGVKRLNKPSARKKTAKRKNIKGVTVVGGYKRKTKRRKKAPTRPKKVAKKKPVRRRNRRGGKKKKKRPAKRRKRKRKKRKTTIFEGF